MLYRRTWRPWFLLNGVSGAGLCCVAPVSRQNLIHRLAQPGCAARADALILAQDRVQGLFQNAIRALNGTLDELRRKGEDRYGASV